MTRRHPKCAVCGRQSRINKRLSDYRLRELQDAVYFWPCAGKSNQRPHYPVMFRRASLSVTDAHTIELVAIVDTKGQAGHFIEQVYLDPQGKRDLVGRQVPLNVKCFECGRVCRRNKILSKNKGRFLEDGREYYFECSGKARNDNGGEGEAEESSKKNKKGRHDPLMIRFKVLRLDDALRQFGIKGDAAAELRVLFHDLTVGFEEWYEEGMKRRSLPMPPGNATSRQKRSAGAPASN